MNQEQNTQQLAVFAANLVMRGAVMWCQQHNKKADPEALAACCRSWAKLKLPEALKDAKDALDCHMHQVAEATFKASMIQAGIEAAKECCQERVEA